MTEDARAPLAGLAVFAAIGSWAAWRHREGRVLVTGLVVFVGVSTGATLLGIPLTTRRYFSIAVAPFEVLVALGIVRALASRNVFAGIAALGSAALSLSAFVNQYRDTNTDWRTAVATAGARGQAPTVILATFSDSIIVRYEAIHQDVPLKLVGSATSHGHTPLPVVTVRGLSSRFKSSRLLRTFRTYCSSRAKPLTPRPVSRGPR